MKTELTTEQSQHLIKLGVPKEKASMIKHIQLTNLDGEPIDEEYKRNFTWKSLNKKPFTPFIQEGTKTTYSSYDIFTLTDVLKILPKEIQLCGLNIIYHNAIDDYYSNNYVVFYDDLLGCSAGIDNELIDALYELTVWCIENGHLKFD